MPQYYDPNGNLIEGDINVALERDRARWGAEVAARQRAAWRRKAIGTVAAGAAMFGGGAALASMLPAGAAAGSAAAGTTSGLGGWTGANGIGSLFAGNGAFLGGTASASAGAGSTMAAGASLASRIPWWQIGSKGVDTLFGIYSNRQQNKADQRATDYMRTRDAEALAYEREREAQRRLEWQQEQDERKRQWEAIQKFEADKWAAMEEERLYRRRMEDEREARQAPYRAASLSALNNLPGLWASGGTSPGLGSLGSYRGGK